MRKTAVMVMCLAFAVSAPRARGAGDDEVLYWNNVLLRSIQTAATPGALQARQAAIVHVAMFDAFNGIDRRYTQIRVTNIFPQDGASRRAAVIQAAFVALVKLFPVQFNALLADRLASLAVLDADPTETPEGIARGLDWGSRVGSEIIMWRVFDGLDLSPSTYVGSMAPGKWRPTPRPNPTPGGPELPGLPGFAPSMATTLPFAIPSPSSFRSLIGPPALTSAQYAAEVNEVKLVGEATSAARTADQTLSARFWAGTVTAFWNRAAATESRARGLSLSENARLFALLNVAGADAIITCWDAKYYFELWRPITAIRLADTDDNPLTTAQPTWTPLLTTPNYPEYDSGHQSGSGVGQYVMTAFFGNNTPVSGFSEGFPGVTLSFPNYAAAADDAFMARIWSGIHFRTAMRDARVRAEAVAAYVLTHTAQPAN